MFAFSLKRPFSVYYNAYTQSIEILDSKEKLAHMAGDVSRDVSVLASALSRMGCC